MKRNGKGVEGEEERGRDSASRRGSAAAGETTSGRGSGIGGGSGSGSGDDPETVYRAMLRRSALQMLAGSGSLTGNLGLRFGGTHQASLPNGGSAAAAAAAAAGGGGGGGSSGQGPDSVRRLSVDECWKLILELGTRWPAWNEATALQATLAARKENNEAIVASTDGGHHLHASDERDNSQQHPQQEFLKRLANRALDALAAQPPSHPSHHGGFFTTGMQAPKQTTQGRLDSRVAAPEAPTISTPPFWKPTISSRDMPAPRAPMTRPSGQELTIFYDGIVNVCDNVPPDKARLIMLFAEKAGLTPQTQKPPRFTPPAPQLSPAPAPQATPIAAPVAVAGSSIPMDLHESKPIPTKVPLLVGSSPLVTREPARTTPIAHDPINAPPLAPPLALARPRAVEGPSSRVKPPVINEALERAKQALAQGKASMAIKNTTGTPSKPRQVRPNVMLKPLPNARRNSLARFLDSRKRQSTSEEVPSKKPNLGEGSQSDAEDSKGIGKPLCSQSSKELKEEDFLTSNKNVVDQAPSKSR